MSKLVSGTFTETDLYGKITEGETVSCVHCQETWRKTKGSEKMRGFCQQCRGFVCGLKCAVCIPIELRIENIEAGRPENTPAPVRILVPDGIDGIK